MYDKSPAKNLNKGYGMESNSTEKKDLMKDNPIDRSASGARGGSWMSKHSKSMGSPMKMMKDSPMEKSGARENHGYHMQTGSDNTQPKGARTDTPSEYWRKHQMAADGHHRSKKPSPAQMQGDLDKDGKMSSYEGKRQAAIEKNMKK